MGFSVWNSYCEFLVRLACSRPLLGQKDSSLFHFLPEHLESKVGDSNSLRNSLLISATKGAFEDVLASRNVQ